MNPRKDESIEEIINSLPELMKQFPEIQTMIIYDDLISRLTNKCRNPA